MRPEDALTLLDWRRRVAEIYAAVRHAPDPRAAWEEWRRAREELYRSHPQSPVPADQRPAFRLQTFPYDDRARTTGTLEPADPRTFTLPSSGEPMRATRFGVLRFALGARALSLDAFWLEGYAGGLFVPFRDATSGDSTYGAGRYLLDTVKGADLGTEGDALVLDFNFAYHPSCALDPRWSCPLAPPENVLDRAIEAGERL